MNYSNNLKIEIFQFEYLKNRVLNFQLLKNQDILKNNISKHIVDERVH